MNRSPQEVVPGIKRTSSCTELGEAGGLHNAAVEGRWTLCGLAVFIGTFVLCWAGLSEYQHAW